MYCNIQYTTSICYIQPAVIITFTTNTPVWDQDGYLLILLRDSLILPRDSHILPRDSLIPQGTH